MPAVPYNPAPSTQPTEAGAPSIRVDTPVAAFGGASAAATTGLGDQVSATSNELFTRALALQQVNNQSQARDISLDAANKLGELRANYLSTSGAQAKDALPAYQAGVADVRRKALAATNNPLMRQYVDADVTQRMARDLDYAGTHAATEFKKYTVNSSKGLVDLSIQGAGVNPEDENAWNANVQHITQQQADIAQTLGLPQAQADFETHTAIASAATKRATSLALTRPDLAMKFYQKDPSIFGANQVQVQKFIQGQLTTVQAKTIADGIVNGPGDYFTRLAQTESGNKPNAQAPTSSAYGLYQATTGTWNSVRAAHPELNLPADAKSATTDQQTAFAKAFTADNSKALTTAGIDASQPNLYMAHFLGAGGAVKFIQGMKEDPAQPGTNLATPAQIEANRSIFQNLDGSPRTAAQVYMRLTANFMGPGPLSKGSDSDWLAKAQQAGTAGAAEFKDFDPNLATAVRSRIETQYNQFHTAVKQADEGSYLQLAQEVGGAGQPNSVTDVSQLMNNPIAASMYANLPPAYQARLNNQMKANAVASPNPTPQRDQNFQKIMNMSVEANGKIPDFLQVDPYSEVNAGNITRAQADKIYNSQRQVLKGQANDSRHLQHVLSITKDYLTGMHLQAGSDEELQYKAELNTWLKDYEEQKKHFPSDDESRKQAASMVASQGGFMGMFSHRSYEVPSTFADKITPEFLKRSGGKAPTAEELGTLYQRSLDHPELFNQVLK